VSVPADSPAVSAPPGKAHRDPRAADVRAFAVRCGVCDSAECRDEGPPAYRLPTQVAGVTIDVSDLQLAHYLCLNCSYRFVHPAIPQERLLDCYRRAPRHHWGTEPAVARSRFYARKRQLLEQFAPGRRVLDFGCYDGGFLAYLGNGWDVAGIEPSDDAARLAESRGVHILGPTVQSVATPSVAPFDAVVMLDVIEHLGEPVAALRALAALLRPGGIVLIETGDTDAPHFRRTGKLYPYCGLVEHVGFFNARSLAEAGRQAAALELAHAERSVHARWPRGALPLVTGYLGDRARIAGYWLLRAARVARVPLPPRLRTLAAGPVPRALSDLNHVLAVLRKPHEPTNPRIT
jgi:SAM-dependent methyltransferase